MTPRLPMFRSARPPGWGARLACGLRSAARPALLLAALLAALPAAVASAQVNVPGDYATLQAALDAVPDGAVIVVHGGTHPSIRIERPVTLVGDPMPTIRTTCCEPLTELEQPAIRLAGPGTGTVVLERIRTQGTVIDGLEQAGGAGIAGGGFSELLVLHADIAGSDGGDPFGNAAHPGGSGIDVSVPYVLLSDSSVRGGTTNYPDDPSSPLVGSFGLRAPGSSVAVLDCIVTGGAVDGTTFGPGSCPPDCDAIAGAAGGTGLLAGTLFVGHSEITGGAGSDCFCNAGTLTLLCTRPAGADLAVDAVQQLGGELAATTPFALGSTCQLAWSASGSPAVLLVALGTQVPVDDPGHGLVFLDLANVVMLTVPTGHGLSDSFSIPTDTSLTGLVATLQLYDPDRGLSAPVVAAFVP